MELGAELGQQVPDSPQQRTPQSIGCGPAPMVGTWGGVVFDGIGMGFAAMTVAPYFFGGFLAPVFGLQAIRYLPDMTKPPEPEGSTGAVGRLLVLRLPVRILARLSDLRQLTGCDGWARRAVQVLTGCQSRFRTRTCESRAVTGQTSV